MSDPNLKSHSLFRLECINPVLRVEDMSVSRNFYVNILGFREADWGDDQFTCVIRDQGCIYLCKGAQGQPGTWLWLGFDGDIYALYNELIAQGVTVRQPPQNYSWSLEMHVEDPDGHVLRFGTEPDGDRPFVDKEQQRTD